MVTKKVTSEPEPETVEETVPDVCDGCAELRKEFEAFVTEVRNNAQGM